MKTKPTIAELRAYLARGGVIYWKTTRAAQRLRALVEAQPTLALTAEEITQRRTASLRRMAEIEAENDAERARLPLPPRRKTTK